MNVLLSEKSSSKSLKNETAEDNSSNFNLSIKSK